MERRRIVNFGRDSRLHRPGGQAGELRLHQQDASTKLRHGAPRRDTRQQQPRGESVVRADEQVDEGPGRALAARRVREAQLHGAAAVGGSRPG